MKVTIETDLTPQGTTLVVDGEKVTDTQKVVNMSFSAWAPREDSPADTGYISLSTSHVDADNNVISKSYAKATYEADKVGLGTTDIKDFIGKPATNKVEIVDKIVKYFEDSKQDKHPTREVLMTRSMNSLKDKLTDLGLELTDSK